MSVGRKKHELSLAGFDLDISELFNKDNFREQIKAFTMKLYVECDDHTDLNDDFIHYMENKILGKGINERIVR